MQRLLLALLLGSLLAVSDPAVPVGTVAERLYGDWIAREEQAGTGTVTTHMHIARDSTFSGSMQVNGATVWTFAGRWRLKGSDITWEYTASSLVLLAEDRAETDSILLLEDNELMLGSGRHGDVRTLARVLD